jgi:hypothetical protein
MHALARTALSSVVLLSTSAGIPSAQTSDSLRAKYLLPRPASVSPSILMRGVPGITVQSPSGFGAEAGDIFAVVGYQHRVQYRTQPDGAIAAGLGFGNATKYLGLETVFTSYGTIRSGVGKHLAFSFKIQRLVSDNLGIAAGWDNVIHSTGTDAVSSAFAVGTRIFAVRDDPAKPFSEVAVTAGVGSGHFQRESRVLAEKQGMGAFGSVSLRIARPASVTADWSGQNLSMALSLVPFARIPLVLTPGVVDITRSSGDGARFILGVGSGVRIRRLRGLLGG